jgi:hypothetical protein
MFPISRSFSIGSQSRSLSPEEKRSRIIPVDGEFQDSKLITETAKLYGEAQVAIKLIELQTLAEIAREKNLIIVTPSGDVSTGNR